MLVMFTTARAVGKAHRLDGHWSQLHP